MSDKTIRKDYKELYALGEELFKHPELGYKEFTNKKILMDYFKQHGIETEELGFRTAFKATIGKGSPKIGLIAELDALPTPGHPFASKTDNAAHSCGHSTQCAITAYTLVKLKDKIKSGSVTVYFTPAEEFTDVAFRQSLIRKGEIDYIGGKINMLCAGQFDNEDLFIHLHTMTNPKYVFSLNTSLSGFVYKRFIFKGKASHAAVSPDQGINALNCFVLFDNAVNMMRETFKEKDHIRIHGVVAEGGQSVNSIPETVVYECYIRSSDEKALIETTARVEQAAKCCAKALGGKVKIETIPGYLPMHQNEAINDVIRKNMLKHCKKEEIHDHEVSMAAGDIGDLSCFKPTVQFGYSGFAGSCHSKDLCIIDENKAYLMPAEVVYDTVVYLLDHPEYVEKIKKEFKPFLSKESYLAYLR